MKKSGYVFIGGAVVVIFVLLFTVGPLKHKVNVSNWFAKDSTNVVVDDQSDNGVVDVNDLIDGSTRQFLYTPPKVQNGRLLGVIELGASGFNAFIINADGNWELVGSEYGFSKVYAEMSQQKEIADGLSAYIQWMIDNNVPGRNIYFVVSSGAVKIDQTRNTIAYLKDMGYVVTEVSAQQEGEYGFIATVPPEFRDKAVLIDVGTGNTKIAWQSAGGVASVEGVGAGYYLDGVSDLDAKNDINSISSRVPAGRTQLAFIIGGTGYKMAKSIRKDGERYTVLLPIDQYEFTEAKLLSGQNILSTFSANTGCDYIIFDWDSNFTIGYLLAEKNNSATLPKRNDADNP